MLHVFDHGFFWLLVKRRGSHRVFSFDGLDSFALGRSQRENAPRSRPAHLNLTLTLT